MNRQAFLGFAILCGCAILFVGTRENAVEEHLMNPASSHQRTEQPATQHDSFRSLNSSMLEETQHAANRTHTHVVGRDDEYHTKKIGSASNIVIMTPVFSEKSARSRSLRMFFESAATSGVDVLAFGDPPLHYPLPGNGNVKHHHITWRDFVDEAGSKLFPQNKSVLQELQSGNRWRKVWDFQPLLGFLFPELLANYEWWGYCAWDSIVLGNLKKAFSERLLNDSDVIITAGPTNWHWKSMILYRNVPKVNQIFRQSEVDLAEIFGSPLPIQFHAGGPYSGPWQNQSANMASILERYAKDMDVRYKRYGPSLAIIDDKFCLSKYSHWNIDQTAYPLSLGSPFCAECIHTRHSLVIHGVDGTMEEVLLCYYGVARKEGIVKASLEDDEKFHTLLKAHGSFRVNHGEGFGLLPDDYKERTVTDRSSRYNGVDRRNKTSNILLMMGSFHPEEMATRSFRVLLESASRAGADVLLFGNAPLNYSLPTNTIYYRMSWSDFVDLASLRIFNDTAVLQSLKYEIVDSDKLTDFYPVMGSMFPEYIQGYEWWGFCGGLDFLLGNLTYFFPEDILDNYDVISAKMLGPSHPLQLFRNTPKVNELYRRSEVDLTSILGDPRLMLFQGRHGPLDDEGGSMILIIRAAMKETNGIRHYPTLQRFGLVRDDFCETSFHEMSWNVDEAMYPISAGAPYCAECIRTPTGLLVRYVDGTTQNVLMCCHRKAAESGRLEASVQDDGVFSQLLNRSVTFRVNYRDGFGVLPDDVDIDTDFDSTFVRDDKSNGTMKTKNNIILLTSIFTESATTKRSLRMFFESAATSGVDVVAFGDPPLDYPLPGDGNVRHFHITWSDLVDRASYMLFGNRTALQDLKHGWVSTHKAVDFRPLFAFLFPEIVEGYEWWGHVDWDLILGNLKTGFPQEMLDQTDIISTYEVSDSSGPLQLYRNIPKVNELFRKSEIDLAQIINAKKEMSFDEWGWSSPWGSKAAHMSGIIKKYASELGIRHQRGVPGIFLINDIACLPGPQNYAWLTHVDQQMYPNFESAPYCAECLHTPEHLWIHKLDGSLLEVLYCHVTQIKHEGRVEPSLADDDKFHALLDTHGYFQVNYGEGYGLLPDEFWNVSALQNRSKL